MPPITFDGLFNDLDKRLNLGVYIDLTGSKPKLIIDEWEALFRNNQVATFENLPNLKSQVAKELIYSNIKFGGKSLDQIANSFPGGVRFLGFKTEKYLIVGNCPGR